MRVPPKLRLHDQLGSSGDRIPSDLDRPSCWSRPWTDRESPQLTAVARYAWHVRGTTSFPVELVHLG
jgi:hypothetical protein